MAGRFVPAAALPVAGTDCLWSGVGALHPVQNPALCQQSNWGYHESKNRNARQENLSMVSTSKNVCFKVFRMILNTEYLSPFESVSVGCLANQWRLLTTLAVLM